MAPILGHRSPRLFTPPLEADADGLPVRTRGHDFLRFAERFGYTPHDWQRELAIRGLETLPDGSYRFRIIVVIVARQAGKTVFMMLLALWLLFERAQSVVAAGQDRSRAFAVWEDALEGIQAHATYSARLGKVWRRTNDEWFRVLDEDGNPAGRYRIKAATRSSARGASGSVVFDELREQTDFEGWAALSKIPRAQPDGQLWAFSNAGDLKAVVLRHLRGVALASSEAAMSLDDGEDMPLGLFEWSTPEDMAIDDRAGWAMSNPTMNRPGGITERAIYADLISDPPEVFRTEVLCQFRDLLDGALDVKALEAMADPAMTMDSVRGRIALVVDASDDLRHISAVAAGIGEDGRARVEVAGAWESAAEMRAELPDLIGRVNPYVMRWFKNGPAAAIRADMEAIGGMEPFKTEEVPAICQGLREQVAGRRVITNGDRLILEQAETAGRKYSGDGWVFVRLGAPDCDSTYGMAGAVHLARTVPVVDLGEFVIR